MARCASEGCQRWVPEFLVRRGAGTSVNERWFCSETCVESSARRRLLNARPVASGIPAMPPMRLGVLLRHCGAASNAEVERALFDQQMSRRRIGAELIANGVIERETLLKALASQSGVSYLKVVDLASVREAPGGLSPDAVRALGVVPFREPEKGTLKVACVAPVPRVAISVLKRLTGLNVEPYLVTDEDLIALLKAYGENRSDRTDRPAAEFVKASSLSDAAARIAATAGRGRHISVTEAVCLPHVWVRMRGEGLIRDMLVDYGIDHEEEETSCPAVNTSH
ncbi:MAG: hypothetical protein ACHQO8_12960 [Vicinamibacterales bacterium]